ASARPCCRPRAAWCTDGSSLAHQLLVRAAGHDLDHAPALVAGERPALLDAHRIADLGAVLLVMRLELAREAHDALVDRVSPQSLHADHHGLVHLVGDHASDLGSPLALHLLSAHQLAAFRVSAAVATGADSSAAAPRWEASAACCRSVMTVRIRAMRLRVAGRRL